MLHTHLLGRRRLLQVGGLGLSGLSLPALLRAQEASLPSGLKPRADACILLFLNGGPSHLDMWDMKPGESDGIRGEFKPIETSLAGYQMCELLPRVAQWMHRATVVRSMHHTVNNAHALAVYTAITGHDRGDANQIVGNGGEDHPTPGSVLSLLRPPERPIIPNVCLPYITKEGAKGPPQPGFFGGFLGRARDPLFILRDPNAPDFSVPELSLLTGVDAERLARRRELFRQIDDDLAQPSSRRPFEAMDGFQRRAFDLLTSDATQRALLLSDEPAGVRDAYGRNIYGQSVLLARRLIEAGTRMVTISWAPDANATWDTHGQNFKKLKGELLPQFDAACGSLVADLHERGLLDRTLVAVLGDFGRTPKVNGNAGRDHWNYCYSVMMLGGGFRGGYIHGTSDRTGAFPASEPMTPGDLVATMYEALGIRHDLLLRDQLARPHRLIPEGRPVRELLQS